MSNKLFIDLAHHVRNDITVCLRLQSVAMKALKESAEALKESAVRLNDLDKNLQILMDEARGKRKQKEKGE